MKINETWIILLIGSVQFVNILDFMMVMPLGPDFAQALSIPTSKLGIVGGSYTAAASVAGVLGSFFLDRFDRRLALFWAMLGLGVGTLAGGFATNLHTLVLARIIAGCFGGPATSLSLSIIADVVPPARRGRAMGAVMGAFSMASIFGVPAGLELAHRGSWKTPFFAVGSLGLLVTILAIALLPPMRSHLIFSKENPRSALKFKNLWRREVILSYSMIAFIMFGAFMMIPNFSGYFQHNLGFPRERLGFLYLVGGTLSFFSMQIAGFVIDKISAFVVVLVATGFLVVSLIFGYVIFPPLLPILAIFTGFMIGMSVRGVCVSSLTSRVPKPDERARFMSFQSAIQHFSAASGAIASTALLGELPNGNLTGVPQIALVSLGTTLILPFILYQVEKQVRRKEARLQREGFSLL